MEALPLLEISSRRSCWIRFAQPSEPGTTASGLKKLMFNGSGGSYYSITNAIPGKWAHPKSTPFSPILPS